MGTLKPAGGTRVDRDDWCRASSKGRRFSKGAQWCRASIRIPNIARLLGLDQDEFATAAQQHAGRRQLDDGLRAWVAERTAAECGEAFTRAEVVASRVFSAADIADDPVYAEREDIVTVDDADLGPVRMQAVIPHFRQHPGKVWRTGPALGQDNHLVYREWLGLGEDELAELEKHDAV
ncbi:CoA transferase [Streptomyces sp. NPDC005181]|uniref:CoA transferase n=1 Tax=Streptomyces sp. NPDC005181 TaxID=3156869 RepID=UPI0033A33CC2